MRLLPLLFLLVCCRAASLDPATPAGDQAPVEMLAAAAAGLHAEPEVSATARASTTALQVLEPPAHVAGGLCARVGTRGAGEVRVSVRDRPDLGFVEVGWDGAQQHYLRMAPLRLGKVARTTYHGQSETGWHDWTVWVSTAAPPGTPALPFVEELLADDVVLARWASFGTRATCAAAPPL
jgi:hypothetical protein